MRRDISEEKVAKESRLRAAVEHLEELKEVKWRQRAHAWWLKEGDRNTKYFHSFASQRKRKNFIKELRREDGSVVEEGEDLSNYILSYFQGLFTLVHGNRMNELLNVVEARVTDPMNEALMAEFSEMEVKVALDSIGDLKAPGPDGMPSIVFKKYWHIMGDHIVQEVLQVLRGELCRKDGMILMWS
jgi:hypothetical protein